MLIPTNSISSHFTYFEPLYKTNSLNLDIETNLEFSEGEIGSYHSILPENIIAINTNEDKTLSLKRNKLLQ